jgi:hypothetical protein
MAVRYVDRATEDWALPEVMRVLAKLEPTYLVVFADRFGMRVASGCLVDYQLVGPDVVPCHPEPNWNGPIEWDDVPVAAVKTTADEVTLVSKIHSPEAHRVARQLVGQLTEVLVLVGGRRQLRFIHHADVVNVDPFALSVNRIKESNGADED